MINLGIQYVGDSYDRHYYRLLQAWDANKRFDFFFSDLTPHEIKSNDVSVVKQVLSTKVHDANYMLALIGKHSDDLHPDYLRIGFKNWQAYEISKNLEYGNNLVVAKLDQSYEAPSEAYGAGGKWVNSFHKASIVEALSSF